MTPPYIFLGTGLVPLLRVASQLAGLEGAGLQLKEPTVIRHEYEDGCYVATLVEPLGVDIFGAGRTAAQAEQDLGVLMAETLHALAHRRAELSPALAQELQALEAITEPRQAESPVWFWSVGQTAEYLRVEEPTIEGIEVAMPRVGGRVMLVQPLPEAVGTTSRTR